MKSTFFEYYDPSEEEIKSIWENSFISLDANVLLNLYRYTESTKNDFFKVLENKKDKLILTYQAGNEYHKNRLTAINSQLKSYDDLIVFLTKMSSDIENELNKYKKHSYINPSTIKGQFTKTFNSVKNNITKLKEEHPKLLNEDPIKDFLTTLFEEKITEPYEDKRLKEIFSEGKLRYEKEVPPGYKDWATKKNREESSLYGDLIIWFQIIDFAKENQKPIIFVTDDLKDDWWYKFNGETKGPRMELLKEFYKKSQQKVLIYNPDSFLRYAKDKMGADIEESTIEEIIDVREKDNLQDFIIETTNKALENAKIQNSIFESINQKHKFFGGGGIIPTSDYFPNYFLSESEKQYFINTYFNLDEKRKKLIDLRFNLDFITDSKSLDTPLNTDQLTVIRSFIKFYKDYGFRGDKIFEAYLSNNF